MQETNGGEGGVVQDLEGTINCRHWEDDKASKFRLLFSLSYFIYLFIFGLLEDQGEGRAGTQIVLPSFGSHKNSLRNSSKGSNLSFLT